MILDLGITCPYPC